jgi:hypothetical protein
LLALLLPLPVLAAGVAYIKFGRPPRSLEVALTFPAFCLWYLGLRSIALAGAVALGYWYLLGSMVSYAVLCGRDRVSKALLICVIATSVVIALVLLGLRGYNPD